MSPNDDISSIADASRPNAGRIYDYLLGGNHNFEIDRQAAEQLLQMVPEMPQWVRLVRWFLGEAVRRLIDEGFRNFLDFASGLPTVDHIHQIAPEGTKVIYSDIDPLTVAYAKEIVAGNPNVSFVECDAGKPETLLESGITDKIFGKNRKAAIGFNGIAWFLTDENNARAMEVLYDWADTGSKLFICDIDHKEESEANIATLDFYKKVGQPVYPRAASRLQELIGKWTLEKPGFQPLADWIKVDDTAVKSAAQRMGGGDLKGAFLKK
jgi:hypothetical protein